MVPGRAGQPTHIQVHLSLSQLRGLPGGSAAAAAWAAARPAWLAGPDADAAACDATVVPVVTGHVDWPVLDRLTDLVLAASSHPPHPDSHGTAPSAGDTPAGQVRSAGTSAGATPAAGMPTGDTPARETTGEDAAGAESRHRPHRPSASRLARWPRPGSHRPAPSTRALPPRAPRLPGLAPPPAR